MTESEDLKVETLGRVQLLTLDRPERANALTPDLALRLGSAISHAATDDDIRVLVITGAGDHFCAGADIKYFKAADESGLKMISRDSLAQRKPYEILLDTPKPTIAALNGAAVAGGLEIALACDMRLMADGAVLGLPEAMRGLTPQFASIMLPRMIPPGIAYEMLYRGRNITAIEAERWGLVNQVVAKDAVLETALAIAQEIADNAPLALRRMKETAVKASGLPLAAAFRLNEGINPYDSEDRIEGFKAYVERRKPEWKGR